jgi:hypothetical protein
MRLSAYILSSLLLSCAAAGVIEKRDDPCYEEANKVAQSLHVGEMGMDDKPVSFPQGRMCNLST